MILFLLQLVVVAACVGFLFRDGMWGNFIRSMNIMFAGILATNFFEPFARFLEDMIGSSLTYFYDFLALWILFAVFFIILHLLTSAASRVKVRFNRYLDNVFSVIYSLAVAGTLLSIFLFSLHLAPLGTKPFGAPILINDEIPRGIRWAAIMEGVSAGVFSRKVSPEEESIYNGPVASFLKAGNVFERYFQRAKSLEEQVNSGKGFTTDSAPPR